MSEIFSYHPKGGESLEAFNARIAQFCSDNPTVDMRIATYGEGGIALSLIEDADVPFPMIAALQPVVLWLDEKRAVALEREVSAYQKRLIEQQSDLSVLRTDVFETAANAVYVVILLHIYDLAQDDTSQPTGDEA